MDRAADPEIGIFKDLSLSNFLGNHDVTRILSQLKDPEDVFPALIFLMTIPGIPFLYYGDEVGMLAHKNAGDPALRKPMFAPDAEWPDREHRLYPVISQLAALRRDHVSLLYGSLISFDAGQGYYAYMRRHVRENAIVILNSGDSPISLTLSVADDGIPDGTRFNDLLDPSTGPFVASGGTLPVPDTRPGWGRLLIADA
jgi:glycosidase